MNATLWIIAGGIMGWLAFARLHVNEARGMIITIIIGASGAYFGGSVVAALFSHAAATPGEFSPFALITACATAAACLLITNMVYERFGV